MSDTKEGTYKEDTFKENIKIIIAGPVSAGKSTFFNALMSNTYSDMKRKKTTMLPQHYFCGKNNNESVEEIYNKNKESNDNILQLRESGEFDASKHFNELVYNISPIDDFVTLPDKRATYSILDMPGLNCGGDELYYDYVKKESKNIDIYVLVFDINSGLNSTDEITILKLVVDEIIKNGNGHVRILINKCDDIQFKNDKIDLGDEELNELYERCKQTINKHCVEIIDRVTVSPLCSSKLYVYRGVKNNISTIDENQLNNLIKTECGKTELKKLDSIKKKRKFISGLLQKSKLSLFDDWMNDTGYSDFKKKLDSIIGSYPDIISYHINADLMKIIDNNKINFDYTSLIHGIKGIVKRITRLATFIEKGFDKIFNKLLKLSFDNLNLLISNNMKNKVLNIKARKDMKKETTNLNIEKVRSSLESTCDYNKILEKVYKADSITNLITLLTNKKNELLMFKFKNNNFNPEIFCELQEFNLIDINFFTTSVINTLKYDISYFNKIYSFLNKDSQKSYVITLLNNYIDIFINSEKKCDVNEFGNFINSLDIITKNKKIDLAKTSMFVNKYLVETGLSRYLEFWSSLNSDKIRLSNETKYIYFYLSKCAEKNVIQNDVEENTIVASEHEHERGDDIVNEGENTNVVENNSVNDDGYEVIDNNMMNESIPNFMNFEVLFKRMDSLFDTIIKNTKKDDSFLEKKINHKNTEKIKLEKTNDSGYGSEGEDDDEDNNSVVSGMSDLSGKTEDYGDDDNSEVVYTKANKNTKKRTNNIINTKIETEQEN